MTSPSSPPISAPTRVDIGQAYRDTFLRGLATLLPTLVTLWAIFATWSFMDGAIATPITGAIKDQLVATEVGNAAVFRVWNELAFLRKPAAAPAPEGLAPDQRDRWNQREDERIQLGEPKRLEDLRRELDARFPRWVGFLLAVLAIFVVGFIMTSVLGASLLRVAEASLTRIPLVKTIFAGTKQMVNFFISSDEAKGFQAVVAIEYPRKGTWSLGFLTSDNVPELEQRSGERVRGVYLGTPAAGQVVIARQSEIVAIDMTVDEALTFLMSGGVVGRDPQRPPATPVLPWERTSQRLAVQQPGP